MCDQTCPTCQVGKCGEDSGHSGPHKCVNLDPMNSDMSQHYWDDSGNAWSE
jgi:hypothetical protein